MLKNGANWPQTTAKNLAHNQELWWINEFFCQQKLPALKMRKKKAAITHAALNETIKL